ncbi:DEAD/DEAH box helicase [Methanolobus sp. ZRKC3]|uniref:DEAD/DEAH box helicase n=1 Tax=Methanolobus sp. ZRKC3 TaxID=3125786 RepID=UPI003251C534
MPKITLDLDEENSEYVLSGDVENALSDISVKSFLFNFLHASVKDENTIRVPFKEDDKESVLKKIHKLLSRYGLSEDHTQKMDKVMDDFYREEQNFKIFAKKAEEIKANRCDKDDFKKFSDSLIKYLPERTLYPLQLLSAYHLAFSQNSCNFSVPGAGKTSVVYGAYAYLKSLPDDDPKKVDKILVVGPLSSFGPWENEFEECFGRNPSSKRLLGTFSREQKVDYLYSMETSELTLIGYQGLINLVDEVAAFLRMNKVMVVLDEAHKIKNVEGGIIAQSALALSRYCRSRVILTGTPLPNGFQDLHNLFKFIWPTNDIIGYNMSQLKKMSSNLSDKRIPSLINNISPYYIRIKKTDLGIPAPIEHEPISVKMGQIQREIYEFIENKYIASLQGETQSLSFRNNITRAKIVRLMQAATNPALLQKPLEEYYREQGLSDNLMLDDSEFLSKISNYNHLEKPAKFVAIKECIMPMIADGKKVVIWTIFVQNILDLMSYLNEIGISSKAIYGEVPVDNDENDENADTRESIIRDFHNPDSSFKVLLANPFSVSESISLHKACHIAIYLERNFNAGQFIQSKDRIHRYGLKPNDETHYYYLTSEQSIDETIHDRLIFKEKRMNEAIESQAIPLFFNVLNEELADQDIRKLIDDYVERNSKS